VVATVGSWATWCARQGWVDADLAGRLERRRVPGDETRAIPRHERDSLWARSDLTLRDKILWRLLYEIAARAEEVLGLDAGDFNLANKRAVIPGKGGGREVVHWQAHAARLLLRLLAGREVGPVFLTHRARSARNTPASVDLCPVTGRARLSYRRAAEAFTEATGYTLHQLRHSALTHLAEDGLDTLILAARCRHHSVRALAPYARPDPEAVARMTAQHDAA
jgi:integrase